MEFESVNRFIKVFSQLNRATKNGIKAPHKPILLLSVIQSIACGEITSNEIEITPQLVAHFKDNWKWLVKEICFKPNFAFPFYHLTFDKFWHLQTYAGKEILLTSSLSIRSFSHLREVVSYAFLDESLFELLKQTEPRKALYDFLLEYYFRTSLPNRIPSGIYEEVTGQILNDAPAVYQHIIEKADDEEIFIRCGVFKKVVPQIYDYTCCISGMRIVTGFDIQMVDACHIVPFSISHNDTICNGISLSPNLHRAFDRGLVTLDYNYRVMVSNIFTENINNNSIKPYKDKLIILPVVEKYYPAQENLEWHRKNVFKK